MTWTKFAALFAVCCIAVLSLVLWVQPAAKAPVQGAPNNTQSTRQTPTDTISGSQVPLADVPAKSGIDQLPSLSAALPSVAAVEAKPAKNPMDYGTFPPCDPKAHPQAASVLQALQDGQHPERLSPMIEAKPFDEVAYRKDAKEYLSVSEPGRVFQSKEPGDDVPCIRRITAMSHFMKQGDKVALSVQVGPGDPVSFAVFDGGRFVENTLPAITVQANSKGVATATYEATTGVIANVSMLCASPTHSGQLRFQMFVELPQGGITGPELVQSSPSTNAQTP